MKKETEGQEQFDEWMNGLYESLLTYTTRESHVLANPETDLADTVSVNQRLVSLRVALGILDEMFFKD